MGLNNGDSLNEHEQMRKCVLSVKVVGFRNISLHFIHDKVLDTPDPYVVVKCPWLKKKYRTITKTNQITAEVEETFRFIIPEDKLNSKQPIKIKVCDDDGKFSSDDTIGKVKFDAASVKIDERIQMTFNLEENRGQVVVEFSKHTQYKPEFRISEDLCEEEKSFLKLRIPKVKTALEQLLGNQSPAFTTEQTPIISMAGSGGGYRAVIGMSGGMAALKDAGLLDALAYTSGLSGSSWYLCSAYANDGVRNEKQEKYHQWLKERMTHDVYNRLLDLQFWNKFKKRYKSLKKAHDQPTGFVDFFGYAVGDKLLGDKMNITMSQLAKDIVTTADVPYPILTSVHAKDTVPASEFYVHVENSPLEISMPRYGLSFSPKYFGSHFEEGIVTRECPEFPLHYYIGSCGCAFSVLLRTMVDFGSEESQEFVHLIDELKHHGPMSPAMEIASENRRRVKPVMIRQQSTIDEDAVSLLPFGIMEKLRGMEFFKDRNYLIERTAEVNSCVYNYHPIPTVYPKKRDLEENSDFQNEILKRMGHRKPKVIETDEKTLSILDAGVVKNVAVESFLRESRRSDIIIVFDMNHYLNDDYYNYMPILQSAEHAWRDGLPFPPINVKELVNAPPREFLVFEGDTDDCPTVLWFTLCNKTFKNLKDYEPNIPFDESMNDGRPFNDFPVYSKGGNYSTYKFNNSELEFEQLHQLMYHNVISHIPEIKEQIMKAVIRRKRKGGVV